MIKIELQTWETDFVAIVEILEFQILPELIVWGQRFFIRWKESNTKIPVYCEARRFAVSFTRSPGLPKE